MLTAFAAVVSASSFFIASIAATASFSFCLFASLTFFFWSSVRSSYAAFANSTLVVSPFVTASFAGKAAIRMLTLFASVVSSTSFLSASAFVFAVVIAVVAKSIASWSAVLLSTTPFAAVIAVESVAAMSE